MKKVFFNVLQNSLENTCARLFLYLNDFLMFLNQSVFWILSSITFETAQTQTEEEGKSFISGELFSFSLNFF